MRRSERIHKQRAKLGSLYLLLGTIIIVVLILFCVFLYKIFTLDKYIYVNKVTDGSAEIVIVDPTEDKIIRYIIPADTMMSSSKGYGEYKLSSLWLLSEKDEVKGKLVAESIAKNFSLPVYLWKDGKNSNLNLYQKIKSFLNKRRIDDYDSVIDSSSLSNSILINFVDPNFSDFTPTVDVDDLTGTLNTIDKLSKIIDTIGGKITSNSKGFDNELDCEISGKNQKIVDIFSEIINCKIVKDSSLTTDLKIRLGAKFAERF